MSTAFVHAPSSTPELETQIHVRVFVRPHVRVSGLQLESGSTLRNLKDSRSLLGDARISVLEEYLPVVRYIKELV